MTPRKDAALRSRRLSSSLRLCGAVSSLAILAHALLSYVEAPVAQYDARPQSHLPFFQVIARQFAALGADLVRAVGGEGALATNRALFAFLNAAPPLVATVATLVAVFAVARSSDDESSANERVIYRWSIVFALIGAMSIPVLVPDFLTSIAWGRMVANGENPYSGPSTAVSAAASCGWWAIRPCGAPSC